ncbi:MAG: tRNA-specific adenosine deaminase [Xanthomonadaceae bacterium]|nr:tRNA-specific adenosine deaminase [Xanthomonadaceae bacterium]
MNQHLWDNYYMSLALDEARQAFLLGETPVGALAVRGNEIIARGGNLKEQKQLAFSHAELEVMTRASQVVGDWRLSEVTLYVTLEPCIMCAGSMLQARLKRLVYGCADPKAGAIESLYFLAADSRLNHQISVTSGVLASQSRQILQQFFQLLRMKNKHLKKGK